MATIIVNTDKKKIESCNDRIKDYESCFDEDTDNAMLADCEDYGDSVDLILENDIYEHVG